MKILTIDQARKGGYSIWDYKNKKMLSYGSYEFPGNKYTFPQAVRMIENLVESLMCESGASAVFIEDVNMRRNPKVFKELSQLQGVLINLFEKTNTLYSLIAPSTWQSFCRARGRTAKELKNLDTEKELQGKSKSKILSIEFVRDNFAVNTLNDNIADAVCMGWYAVNNIRIEVVPQADFKE